MPSSKEPISTGELLALIEQQLNAEAGAITIDMALADIKGWDSMGVLLLMAELDDRLGMTLSSEVLAELKHVKDIINAVKEAGLLTD
ncbi:MAG TPA: acyl carrier protein [Cellvibrio sp.]|nr:acyl carrier protein [Cellvibrio sp.]